MPEVWLSEREIACAIAMVRCESDAEKAMAPVFELSMSVPLPMRQLTGGLHSLTSVPLKGTGVHRICVGEHVSAEGGADGHAHIGVVGGEARVGDARGVRCCQAWGSSSWGSIVGLRGRESHLLVLRLLLAACLLLDPLVQTGARLSSSSTGAKALVMRLWW